MLAFLIKRILLGLLTLFVVITLVFFMVRLMPGSPFDKERKLPPAIEKNLLKKYRLDGTAWQQYSDYISDLLHGDLRPSLRLKNRTVKEIISQTLPVSLALGSVAFVIAIAAGVTLGSVAAIKHRTWVDRTSMILAILSISIPSFVIAPLLILIFSLKLALFPVAGWDDLWSLFLPAVCLALPFAAYVARLTRNSMLDVINQDYIRTARAKGLDECRIIAKHALKIAILPVVSYSGPLAANILTGSLIIEEIFKIPGIGPFFVNSVLNRDHFMTLGTVIIYSSLLISFNIVVDVIYTWLDRRIKLT